MSTITLPNIRVGSDLQVRVRLKDGGVAIDWSTLSNIKAYIYADDQRSIAGRCSIAVDGDDPTLLVCDYSATKPQYLGVNRIIVCATYLAETKNYDKPAFNFVRWTADQEGEEIQLDDPDVDVDIEVQDVTSSILDEAVRAALAAAERAEAAAAAAEHMVDIHTGPQGPDGKSAYQCAVDEGYIGTEEEWLASLKGTDGADGADGADGDPAGFGTVSASVGANTGTPSVTVTTSGPDTAKNITFAFDNLKGATGETGATPAFSIGTVTTGAAGSQAAATITGTAAAPILNLTIPQGDQGNTGSSVDYAYELVNNLTTNDATKGLSAAQGVVLDGKVSQLEAELYDTGVSTTIETFNATAGTTISTSDSVFPVSIASGKTFTVKFTGDSTKITLITALYTCDSSGNNRTNIISEPSFGQLYTLVAGADIEYMCLYIHSSKIVSSTDFTIEVTVPGGEVGDILKIRGELDELDARVGDIEESMVSQSTLNAEYYDGWYILNGVLNYGTNNNLSVAVYDLSEYIGLAGTITTHSANVNNQYVNLWGIFSSFETSQVAISSGPKTNEATEDTLNIPSSGKYLVVQTFKTDHTVSTSISYTTIPKLENDISSLQEEVKQTLEIVLPKRLFAVVGDTFQVFFRGIVKAKDPYRYDIRVSCVKGSQFKRYFEYTPAIGDIGTNDFTISVYDDNSKLIAEESCELVTVAPPSSPGSQLNVVCIGDSLTANGEWPDEAMRRLVGTGGTPSGKELVNISFLGKLDGELAKYYAAGGWSWVSYVNQGAPAFRFQVSGVTSIAFRSVYSNNGHNYTVQEVNVTDGTGTILCSTDSAENTPSASGTLTKVSGSGDASVSFSSALADRQNPLWDTANNKFSFVPYANAYCNGQIDVLIVCLSYNGTGINWNSFPNFETAIETFAETLHTEFPSAKFVIMGGIIPNPIDAHTYGAVGNGDIHSMSDTFGLASTGFALNKLYKDMADEYNTFADFLCTSAQFDSDYNYPVSNRAVNTRNSETEEVAANVLHPTTGGYLQVADAVYRYISANFCQ